MRDKIPLRPGTSNPKMNLSWDTRIWTAAAVVKPDTRVSERYTTMKPTCRRPMPSCKRTESLFSRFTFTSNLLSGAKKKYLENSHEEGH